MGMQLKWRWLALTLLVPLIAFSVLLSPASPVSAAASITLSRHTLAPNDRLIVRGFGFAGSDDVVVSASLQVFGRPQQVQTSVQTDGNGNFSATLTLPGGTSQGLYIAEARDFHGHQASQSFTVIPLAYLVVNGPQPTTFVIPQHAFFVSGAGFRSGEFVHIHATFPQFNGNDIGVNKTVRASAKGSFYEAQLFVPGAVKAVSVTITATGVTSGRVAKGFLRVVYRPALTLGSTTVRPGENVRIIGQGFVPGSNVFVAVTIPRTGLSTITLSNNVRTDGRGDFSTAITLPSDTRLGKYEVSARDAINGIHASTTLTVSVHPTIMVKPTSVYPGQAITVSGTNFGSGVQVTVSATFPLHGGGTRTVSTTTTSGAKGGYSAQLAVPSNASASGVTVIARSSNARVQGHVQVQQRPATPVPAATTAPTNAPAPTPTPVAAPGTSHHRHFGFRYVSIWYHYLRVGTTEHIIVQSTLHTKLGIWVHIYFPSGTHDQYFQNTNGHGKWTKTVFVGRHAYNPHSGQVVVTIRLWHGSQSREKFTGFNLVR